MSTISTTRIDSFAPVPDIIASFCLEHLKSYLNDELHKYGSKYVRIVYSNNGFAFRTYTDKLGTHVLSYSNDSNNLNVKISFNALFSIQQFVVGLSLSAAADTVILSLKQNRTMIVTLVTNPVDKLKIDGLCLQDDDLMSTDASEDLSLTHSYRLYAMNEDDHTCLYDIRTASAHVELASVVAMEV